MPELAVDPSSCVCVYINGSYGFRQINSIVIVNSTVNSNTADVNSGPAVVTRYSSFGLDRV